MDEQLKNLLDRIRRAHESDNADPDVRKRCISQAEVALVRFLGDDPAKAITVGEA